MSIDEKDKYFFSIVLKQGDTFEDVMKKSNIYNIHLEDALKNNKTNVVVVNNQTNETFAPPFIPFGRYNEDNETFIWNSDLYKKIYADMKKNGILKSFKDTTTLKKLFSKSEIKIPKIYQNVIPYLLAILKSHLNIIRFENEDSKQHMYVGIPFGIPDNFDLNMFYNDLDNYANYKKQTKIKQIKPPNKK